MESMPSEIRRYFRSDSGSNSLSIFHSPDPTRGVDEAHWIEGDIPNESDNFESSSYEGSCNSSEKRWDSPTTSAVFVQKKTCSSPSPLNQSHIKSGGFSQHKEVLSADSFGSVSAVSTSSESSKRSFSGQGTVPNNVNKETTTETEDISIQSELSEADTKAFAPELPSDDVEDAVAEEELPDMQSAEYLEPYTYEEMEMKVEIKAVPDKGRCLFTKYDLTPGAIVYVELPVLVATPQLNTEIWKLLNELHSEKNFDLPPIWHLAAIHSALTLTDETRKIFFGKWVPDPEQAPSNDVLRVLKHGMYDIDPNVYERLLMVWRFNSFGHQFEAEGLVLYNMTSMMAHSCDSTASWHYGENHAFVLRSRVNLHAGDELTISYIGDDDLYKSTIIRREKLTGWLFLCKCLRCQREVDISRGFRCPACQIGTAYLQTDENDLTTCTQCDVCQIELEDQNIQELVEQEYYFTSLLDQVSTLELHNVDALFEQVSRFMTHHWIVYQLHSTLFELYRDMESWDRACYYQQQRIYFLSQVLPLCSFTLAWLYEEMGDVLSKRLDPSLNSYDPYDLFSVPLDSSDRHLIVRQFSTAEQMLRILCGDQNQYTVVAMAKRLRVLQAESTENKDQNL